MDLRNSFRAMTASAFVKVFVSLFSYFLKILRMSRTELYKRTRKKKYSVKEMVPSPSASTVLRISGLFSLR